MMITIFQHGGKKHVWESIDESGGSLDGLQERDAILFLGCSEYNKAI